MKWWQRRLLACAGAVFTSLVLWAFGLPGNFSVVAGIVTYWGLLSAKT